VLDRLCEADRYEIDTISATSAGAVNAVALAGGLLEGGPEGARTLLRELWGAVVKAATPDLAKFNPMLAGLGNIESPGMAQLATMMSPYTFNPFDFNPLRRLLSEMIDFEAIAKHSKLELLIAATDASSGQARLFRRKELTVDVVMASACLPMLYKAVKIGDSHYWDGGFAANPDLVTLARVAKARDSLIVLLNPTSRAAVPTQAADIMGQINRITFNQPLLRDVREIVSIREAMAGPQGMLVAAARKRVAKHRFHLVDGGPYTATLPEMSKMRADRVTSDKLFEAGRHETEGWLARHGAGVGHRETVDLAMRLLAE
jgi:NTE family protein